VGEVRGNQKNQKKSQEQQREWTASGRQGCLVQLDKEKEKLKEESLDQGEKGGRTIREGSTEEELKGILSDASSGRKKERSYLG